MAGPYGFSPNPVPSNGAYGEPGQRLPDFSTGINGETDPGNVASSLNQTSARFNAQVPTGYRPSSLTPVMRRSANGMSADQAALRFADGTPMGTPNGQAADQFERAALLRLAGQDTGIE